MTEPQAQPPERIYIHPTSAEWHPNKAPLEGSEYIGYVREDLPRAAADDARLFKNACRLHTAWTIDRYLMSNAVNRCDPAEKAERHIELCKFYVAAVHGCSPEDAMCDYDEDFDRLHEESQALTSSLNTEIGFPLDQTPDYEALNPKFFERFHEIACRVLTTPRVETGLTVEAALAELEQMLPGDCPRIEFNDYRSIGGSLVVNVVAGGLQVGSGATLNEAMQQVRAWAKSRVEREGK